MRSRLAAISLWAGACVHQASVAAPQCSWREATCRTQKDLDSDPYSICNGPMRWEALKGGAQSVAPVFRCVLHRHKLGASHAVPRGLEEGHPQGVSHLRGHLRQSVAISDNQWQSVAISDNQWHSAAFIGMVGHWYGSSPTPSRGRVDAFARHSDDTVLASRRRFGVRCTRANGWLGEK